MSEPQDDHWLKDKLGRKQDAAFLYNFVLGEVHKRKAQGRTASYVLNVDAEWGGGKSFFLDGLAQDIEVRGHLVARVNAWRDDHAQEPYVAIMAAIDQVFAPYTQKPGKVAKAWAATKSSGGAIALKVGGAVLKGLLKKHLGVSTDEIRGLVSDVGLASDDLKDAIVDGSQEAAVELEKLFDASLEVMIDGFKRTDAAMTDFRLKLEKAVAAIDGERKWPLFVLVDELDRCRPNYAVELLERVKHLFEVEGVVFIFATNSSQLQHTITGAYGANFDGYRYLKRFFERTYVFEKPSMQQLVDHLCTRLPLEKIRVPEEGLATVIALGCEAYELDLRATEHVIEMMDAAASAWPHRLPIEIVLLFPLCVHFYTTGKAEWPFLGDELDRWRLTRPASSHRYPNGRSDASIKLGNAYSLAVALFDSLDKISEASSEGRDDPTRAYILRTFEPEWNGKSVSSAPSIQRDLLGLVANAGRMIGRDEEPPDNGLIRAT